MTIKSQSNYFGLVLLVAMGMCLADVMHQPSEQRTGLTINATDVTAGDIEGQKRGTDVTSEDMGAVSGNDKEISGPGAMPSDKGIHSYYAVEGYSNGTYVHGEIEVRKQNSEIDGYIYGVKKIKTYIYGEFGRDDEIIAYDIDGNLYQLVFSNSATTRHNVQPFQRKKIK